MLSNYFNCIKCNVFSIRSYISFCLDIKKINASDVLYRLIILLAPWTLRFIVARFCCFLSLRSFPWSIQDVSRQLFMSALTLRRRLAAEGTSFQRLLDDVRLNKALAAIPSTLKPISVVARENGYMSPSPFPFALKNVSRSHQWRYVGPLDYKSSRLKASRSAQSVKRQDREHNSYVLVLAYETPDFFWDPVIQSVHFQFG